MEKLNQLGLNISFCVSLLAPLLGFAVSAPAQNRDDIPHHRYWDEEHHDYHRWNRAEDRQWRLYWTPQRGPFISWEHANEEQRRAYWRWRHDHR